jgi:hypothetical protein
METLRHGNTHAYARPVTIVIDQCFSLSPFDINGKRVYLLGVAPPVSMPLFFLFLFDQILTSHADMSPLDTVHVVINHGEKNNSLWGYVSPFLHAIDLPL